MPAALSPPLLPITLAWDPSGLAQISGAELGRGLWERSMINGSTGLTSPPDSAWVLLTGPDDYARLAASFEDALARVKTWGPNVSPEASRGYLRATLEYVAGTGGHAGGC